MTGIHPSISINSSGHIWGPTWPRATPKPNPGEDFAHWLYGYLNTVKPETLDKKQVETISAELNRVIDELDKLNEINMSVSINASC